MTDQPKFHELSDKPMYNAKAVTLQTGLTPATLRAWERRYGVLLPDRTSGGHRLYSDRDVASLKWLKQQTEQGLSIGRASEILKHMLATGEVPAGTTPLTAKLDAYKKPRSMEELVIDLHKALTHYDEVQAETLLNEAYALYPIDAVCIKIILPVFQLIGNDWEAGRIQVATEHFATNYLRRKMVALIDVGPITRSGTIVTGCAPDDLHEGGILFLSIFLRRNGWKVVYLGQMVALDDLSTALKEIKAQVVVLSATLADSARKLIEVPKYLQQIDEAHRPVFAFGGAAFNHHPELRSQIDGVFLGQTVQMGLETIERLMTK